MKLISYFFILVKRGSYSSEVCFFKFIRRTLIQDGSVPRGKIGFTLEEECPFCLSFGVVAIS